MAGSIPLKYTFALLTAVVFIVGGFLATLAGLGHLLSTWTRPPTEAGMVGGGWMAPFVPLLIVFLTFGVFLGAVVVIPVILICFAVGGSVGAALCLLAIKPWYSRADLERYIVQSRAPVLSSVLRWTFSKLYKH